MKEWLIYGVFSVVVLGGLAAGVTMLLAPEKYMRFEDWMRRADKWSIPNPRWKPGRYLQLRLAGLAIIAIAVLMMRPLLRVLLSSPSGHPPEASHPATPATNVGPDLFALGVGLVMILGGAYTLIRPDPFLRWTLSRLPHRIFAEEAVSKSRPGARIMGGAAIVAGAFAIYAWLKTIG